MRAEESLRALIAAGADVNKCLEGDYSPLMHAIWFEHKGCVEALLDAGAKIDVRDQDGFTPQPLEQLDAGPSDLVIIP